MAKRWYIVHAYSNFEKKVAEDIEQKAAEGPWHLFEQILVPTEKVVEMRRGRKVDAERKFFPGYVLVSCQPDGRGFSPDQEHAEGHRLPRRRQQAGADPRQGSRAHPAAGAGGRRAAEAVGDLRDRRAGPRRRWAVRLLQRQRPGSRRGARAAQGGGFDLRPRRRRSSWNTVRSRRSDPKSLLQPWWRRASALPSNVGGEAA